MKNVQLDGQKVPFVFDFNALSIFQQKSNEPGLDYFLSKLQSFSGGIKTVDFHFLKLLFSAMHGSACELAGQPVIFNPGQLLSKLSDMDKMTEVMNIAVEGIELLNGGGDSKGEKKS